MRRTEVGRQLECMNIREDYSHFRWVRCDNCGDEIRREPMFRWTRHTRGVHPGNSWLVYGCSKCFPSTSSVYAHEMQRKAKSEFPPAKPRAEGMTACSTPGKQVHSTRERAHIHLLRVKAKDKKAGDLLNLYYCTACQGWHVGHRPKGKRYAGE